MVNKIYLELSDETKWGIAKHDGSHRQMLMAMLQRSANALSTLDDAGQQKYLAYFLECFEEANNTAPLRLLNAKVVLDERFQNGHW